LILFLKGKVITGFVSLLTASDFLENISDWYYICKLLLWQRKNYLNSEGWRQLYLSLDVILKPLNFKPHLQSFQAKSPKCFLGIIVIDVIRKFLFFKINFRFIISDSTIEIWSNQEVWIGHFATSCGTDWSIFVFIF